MRATLIIIVLFLIFGCTNSTQYYEGDSTTLKITNEKGNEDRVELSEIMIEKGLTEFFGKIDSAQIMESLGCTSGYYGLVSSKYVLRIASDFIENYQSLDTVIYDVEKDSLECELLVFNDDSAHLGNICSDLHINNLPKSIEILKAKKGNIKIFFGKDFDYYGTVKPEVFIKINSLNFSQNGQKVEIEDKLMWKVIYLGRAG